MMPHGESRTPAVDIGGFHSAPRDDVIRDVANVTDPTQEKKEAALQYCHLADEVRSLVDALLRGRHPLNQLPTRRSRVIRIFISSTFTDMLQERNALMTNVFPLLKSYCRERYGIDFQVVDMRWGISTDVADNHKIVGLCLDEIRSCQRLSIGPNFVAFLGQRYGGRCLPAEIPQHQYKPIRELLVEQSYDVTVLDQWYLKDSNSLSGAYILQPISTILGEDVKDWLDIRDNLLRILTEAAAKLTSTHVLDGSLLHTLKSSVTEMEVSKGILTLPRSSDRDRNCLCFVRTISDLKDKLDRSKANRFVDQAIDSQQIDTEKKEAIDHLANNKVPNRLRRENVIKNTISWSDPCGVDPQDHKDYLDKVCKDFHQKIRNLIDYNVAHQGETGKDELYDDVLQHWAMAKDRVDGFLGREPELETIRDYVTGVTNQPLVLFGESGCGKTSIIAKAASEVLKHVQDQSDSIQATVILRFCGTSPYSSNVRQLLKSLCHQIAYATNDQRSKVPDDDKGMKQYFSQLLQHAKFRGLVVIFLDALDQLDSGDNAHRLDWLPPQLANNVKVIVSTCPTYNILLHLRSKVSSEKQYVEVGQMKPGLCCEIINSWLTDMRRTLQFSQWKVVKEAFTHCALPLFAKLMFEEVKTWKSYTAVGNPKWAALDNRPLSVTITSSINCLFNRLETRYGETLVSHTLGYLTASQSGLGVAEMEDILSLDDRVLNSVFVYWLPPIRRIPSVLWPRIKHEIDCYLVEREKDETTVEFWYHRQFVEVATERYLQGGQGIFIHSTMADYYLGMWSRMVKKPFHHEPLLMKRLGIKEPLSSAVRYVPEQPLEFQTFTDGNKRYNLRKLSQLPQHLVKSHRILEIAKHVYFNYEWLITKLRACSVQEVITDFNLVNDREVQIVGNALRMAETALARDPNVLGPEITGRLLPHYRAFPNIKKLVDGCDLAAIKDCPLVPQWQCFTAPGGPLQYECEAEPDIKSDIDVDIIHREDTLLMIAKPFHSAQIRIWDIIQGEDRPGMTLTPRSEVFPSLDGNFIHVFKNNRFLQTYQLDSASLYGEVEFGHGNIGQVAVANKYFAFCLVKTVGPVVIDTEARALLHRFQYQSDVVAISNNDRYLLCNSGQCITLHEFPLMERKFVVKTPDLPRHVVFSKDNKRFYVMMNNKMLQSYEINLKRRTAAGNTIAHDVEMQNFVLSHKEELLLVRCSRRLFVFDTNTASMVSRIQKMPEGVFMEQLSTFVEARFTKDDVMVVGVRNTYLGIWEAKTGKPLRLLQSSVSPIVKMFTSNVANKAITLRGDNSIQVWDLNNIDTDVQHNPGIIGGKINAMSVANKGPIVVVCGAQHAEARVFNMDTGQVERSLVHSKEVGCTILEVIVSPKGRFAVTRCENKDHPEENHPWPLLREDKLWDLETGDTLLTVTRSRYVTFSSIDDTCVFFQARMYSRYDWSVNSYDALVYNLVQREEVGWTRFPDGDVIGHPVISGNGAHLAVIMQQCYREVDASYTERNRHYEITLCAMSFHNQWRGIKYIDIHNIWSGVGDSDNFLDLQVVNEENILVTYAKDCVNYAYNKDGSVDRNKDVGKGAFLYNLKKDCLIKRIYNLAHLRSNVEQLEISKLGSVVIDDKFTAFDVLSGDPIHNLKISNAVAPGSVHLILDGRYVAAISSTHREVLVFRTSDGVQKGKLFTHGYATHLGVAADDRSLVIGCRDGRLLILTVVLELCSPAQECIWKLPSRQSSHLASKTDNAPSGTTIIHVLDRDVHNINKTLPEIKQLSTKTTTTILQQRGKPPSFEAVSTGVALLTEYNRKRSRACVIQ